MGTQVSTSRFLCKRINVEGMKQAFTLLIGLQVIWIFCVCELNRKLIPVVDIVKLVMLVCICVHAGNAAVA